MTYREHIAKNFTLAFPVMLSQLGHVMVGVADSVMVGQLGTVELAAVSLGGAPFHLIMLFGIGISYGITPLVAAADGNENANRINILLKHALVVDFIVGILLSLLLIAAAPYLGIIGQEAEVLDYAIPYINIVSLSLIPLMVFQAFRQFVEGVSMTKQAMYISISANVINVILNYLLIYGALGFPELGLNGAAWATFISRVLMAVGMGVFVFRSRRLQIYTKSLGLVKLSMRPVKSLLQIGIPSGLQFIFEAGAFAMATVMIGWLGAEALAAHQIALNLAGITYMTASGISAAATIRVGNQFGKGDFSTMRLAGFSCFLMVGIFMAVCALAFMLGREFLPNLYVDDAEVIAIAAQLMIIAAIFQISDGIQVVGLGALRGLSDVKVPTMVTALAFWVLAIPLGYLLGFVLDYGAFGVWIGLLLGLSVAGLLHLIRFNHKSNSLLSGSKSPVLSKV